jgi:DNA-binding NarL/FixJ family response regulator
MTQSIDADTAHKIGVLTKGERQVATLVGDGMANKAIAHAV